MASTSIAPSTTSSPPSPPDASPPRRTAFKQRLTKETSIQVSLSLDGGPLDLLPNDEKFTSLSSSPHPPSSSAGAEITPTYRPRIPSQETEHHACQMSPKQQIWIWTGVGFLDHMLHALAKHAGWSLRVRCWGDLASKLFFFFSFFWISMGNTRL